MKKIIILLFAILSINVYAKETKEVEERNVSLINCTDPGVYWVNENNEDKIVKLIAVDINDEYKEDVCSLIKSATKITITNDVDINDKYNREMVWMYLDDKLLQETIIELGYGQVDNVYNEYKNIDYLCSIQKESIISKKGIWENAIQESYCNSGIDLEEKNENNEETTAEEIKIDKNVYFKLCFFSIGIVLLSILLIKGVKYGKER